MTWWLWLILIWLVSGFLFAVVWAAVFAGPEEEP